MTIQHEYRPDFYYQSGKPQHEQNHTAFGGHFINPKLIEYLNNIRIGDEPFPYLWYYLPENSALEYCTLKSHHYPDINEYYQRYIKQQYRE